MLKSHVSQQLSAYVLGELPAEESRLVAAHILACQRCRQEYEEIKLGAEFASKLTPVAAPPDLWDQISAQLNQTTPEKSEVETRSFGWPTAFTWPQFAAIGTGIIIVLLGLAWFARRQQTPQPIVMKPTPQPTQVSPAPTPALPLPSPALAPPPKQLARGGGSRTTPAMEIISLNGEPTVASNRISGRGKMGIGEWLETDGQSRAQIKVGEIGKVEVDPNSRISLVATNPTEHRLKLARGRMQASIYAPPRIFIVETPTATAIDLGCEYTLEVDESGASVLRVSTGFVALADGRREVIVPAGAVCQTRPGKGPGTPYFPDATAAFQRALARFDINRDENADVQILLDEARRRDTLTLWHLLSIVSPARREQVYDRLAEIYAPPDGVTKQGILKLDREMMDAYRKRLTWLW
jgi:hypothetical protein